MSGIVGIWSSELASIDLYLGLYALQHRGTKYAGITISNESRFHKHSKSGLLRRVFEDISILREAKGASGIGIVGNRISTDATSTHAQPCIATIHKVPYSACLSGVVTNHNILRDKLEKEGAILATDSYAELLVHLANRSRRSSLIEKTIQAIDQLEGSFTIIVLTPYFLLAARDSLGNRPLSLGALPDGGFIIASETTAFGPVRAKFTEDVPPGGVLVISRDNLARYQLSHRAPYALCSLELINLASSDSQVFGKSTCLFRKEIGAIMGRQESAKADIVIPTPKSGLYFVAGFSEATGLPIVMALTSNDFAMRESFPNSRSFLNVKFSLIGELITGENVILVDDIVQSTRTAQHLIRLLEQSGKVKRIYLRACCPPVKSKLCPFRRSPIVIEVADYEVFGKKDPGEFLGVTSFDFPNLEIIKRTLGEEAKDFCFACLK